MIKRNLNYLMSQATANEIDHGLDWYRQARVFAYNLSQRHGVAFVQACGVIAALSPRNRWERNMLDAERLIKAIKRGNKYLPKCATYKMMRKKAVKVLTLEKPCVKTVLNVLNGPKISAFFLNIFDGENNRVTVDTWIQLAAGLEYLKVDSRPTLKKAQYGAIENALKELAAHYGIKPYQAQAIVWLVFKRLSIPTIASNRKAA